MFPLKHLGSAVGIVFAASVFVAGVLCSVQPAAGAQTKTLDNLQTAYEGESNAAARYLAYAQRADAEGYGETASLFRAAARAEQIHAAAHGKVIKKLGGTPKANVKTPEARSTRENLKTAIEGESYERDRMYPEFIKQAQSDGVKEGLRSFNYAIAAETEHAKLYTAALNRLDSTKGMQKATYYVCTVCGYTTARLDFSKCPSCFHSKKKYVAVS